ncbi:Alcohol dehydrogenase 2 [Penicillium rolfsii]|nr:Alcohol dehydrogenase 2 [Penicillium rolfsii]
MSVPQVQKAVVVENPGDNFTVVLHDNVPVGDPGPDEILIKLNCTGICHSEVRAVLGWGVYNSIIGHEGVGTVVKAGPNVSPSLIGQRVGFKWLYNACTKCSVCRRGFFQNCPKQLNTSRHVPGTLQQYAIADARFITRIPDGVPDEVAAPLLCAGLTMAGALAHLENELQPGNWIVISGSGGGLGHIGVQLAARVKKLRVIGVDTGDEKRDLSLSSGAEAFIDFKTEDVTKRVLELTEEGAHATIVVPGTKEAFQMAPTLVRNMGHIICVGLPRNDIELPISATLCAARGLTIKGSSVGSEEQMTELLQLAQEGIITPAIGVFEFSEAPDLIERITKDAILGRAVVRIP